MGFVLLIFISVPLTCLSLLNLFFIVILIEERLSVQDGFVRFTRLCANANVMGYMAGFFALFALVSLMLELCTLLSSAINFSNSLPSGALKELFRDAESLLRCVISMPVYAFVTGAGAAGCAGLYTQLIMKLEGADLVKNLAQVKQC
jgi:hypothetical protein